VIIVLIALNAAAFLVAQLDSDRLIGLFTLWPADVSHVGGMPGAADLSMHWMHRPREQWID
jgi:hypothetical protein